MRLGRLPLSACLLGLHAIASTMAADTPADWHEVARVNRLSPAQIQSLERTSFVVTPRSLPRAFESLKEHSGTTAFLTPDIAIEAFHTLLDDSMESFAIARREPLASYLDGLWRAAENAAGSPCATDPVFPKALRHIHLTLGPALVLLGHPVVGTDAEESAMIVAEVDRIRAGRLAEAPTWLEAPSDDLSIAPQERIDYSAFSPTGFYARTPQLADLFRATRWLQSIPFRARIDHEAVAATLLGNDSYEGTVPPALTAWFELIGPYRTPVVSDFFRGENFTKTSADLVAAASKTLVTRAPFEIDPERRNGSDKAERLSRLVFHILPSGLSADQDALNSAVLATRRSDTVPTGLVLADWLGFNHAATAAHAAGWTTPTRPWVPRPSALSEDEQFNLRLGEEESLRADVLNARSASISAALLPTPHDHLLALWRALARPPAPWAPDFMRQPVWQAKAANAALASWTLTHHAFALEKPDGLAAIVFGVDEPPPLIVEPVPEVWSAFRTVVEAFELEFRKAELLSPYTSAEMNAAFVEESAGNRSALDKLKLVDRWSAMGKVARSTERLCLRQGAGIQPDDEDRYLVSFLYDCLFFATTGDGGGFMGASGQIPRDLAPQVTPIWNNPTTHATLHVAVGRPRQMWVLYPWEGKPVLCRSAVLTYHEFVEPDGKRVGDEEWKARLDAKTPPKPPEWLAPLFGE